MFSDFKGAQVTSNQKCVLQYNVLKISSPASINFFVSIVCTPLSHSLLENALIVSDKKGKSEENGGNNETKENFKQNE